MDLAAVGGRLPPRHTHQDKAFSAGASQTFPNGDIVSYGVEGEVTGPAIHGPSQCLAVMFPGSKGSIQCDLTRLSRTAPPPS